jgi:tetratricopeptide (TPR) repeat protein
MTPADKRRRPMLPLDHFRRKREITSVSLVVLCFLVLAGCDQMVTPPRTQLVKDADTKSAQGDFLRAIGLYETALDGTVRSAEIHYKLALLYDDKMNDPLNALHHFKRYLILNPNGTHATEVKEFMKRDEIALMTNLSGDSVVTRVESVRLRNENLALRKQVEERALKARAVEEKPQPRSAHAEKAATRKAGGQTYIVETGDTLFSISRKFYNSPSRWKEIRDANKNAIDDPAKLQPGQSLIIP